MPTIISTPSCSPPPPAISSPSLSFPNPNRLLSPNRPVKASASSNHHLLLHFGAAAPLLSPWIHETSSCRQIFPSFAFTNHSLPETHSVWEAPDYGSDSDDEEENEEQENEEDSYYGSDSDDEEENEEQENEEDSYYAKKTAQVIQYEEELRKGFAFLLVFLYEVDVVLTD
ncbi:hypothetical protein ACLOJK_004114 [Asimina triloba]